MIGSMAATTTNKKEQAVNVGHTSQRVSCTFNSLDHSPPSAVWVEATCMHGCFSNNLAYLCNDLGSDEAAVRPCASSSIGLLSAPASSLSSDGPPSSTVALFIGRG